MGAKTDALSFCCVLFISGQNIADCLSRLTKIPASSHHGRLAEEYVRMVAHNATPRALTTSEIERASADDEELTKVRAC